MIHTYLTRYEVLLVLIKVFILVIIHKNESIVIPGFWKSNNDWRIAIMIKVMIDILNKDTDDNSSEVVIKYCNNTWYIH